MNSPWRLIAIGLVLLVLGIVIPFMILVKVLASTLFLNFFAFGASVTGLFLGVIGAANLSRTWKE